MNNLFMLFKSGDKYNKNPVNNRVKFMIINKGFRYNPVIISGVDVKIRGHE